MTDTRLREARRAWAETGTPEAAAAYLRALERSGALPAAGPDDHADEPGRLPSLRVLGEAEPSRTGSRKELGPCTISLGGDGYDYVRVLLSYGRPVACCWWNGDAAGREVAWDPDAAYSQTSRQHLNRWLRRFPDVDDDDPRALAVEVDESRLREIIAGAVLRGLGV